MSTVSDKKVTQELSSAASSPWRGRLFIVIAAILWSTSGFFAKAPWFDAWAKEDRGLLLAFWRSLFACLVLVPMIRRPVWRWEIVPMLACFAVMVWSFMSAMVHGPAANAIWLQYLCPAWVMVVGVIFLREKVVPADVLMFVLCLAGVVLILLNEFQTGSSLRATLLGLLSGVTFAGVVITMRLMREVDSAWLITLNHGATVLVLLPWLNWQAPAVSWGSYVALGMFGVFQMSVPYILFARGLRSISSPEASVLTLIEPILVPIWVFLAWRHHPSYEPPQWWTWTGGALIMLGLLGRYLPAMVRASQKTRRRMRGSI